MEHPHPKNHLRLFFFGASGCYFYFSEVIYIKKTENTL